MRQIDVTTGQKSFIVSVTSDIPDQLLTVSLQLIQPQQKLKSKNHENSTHQINRPVAFAARLPSRSARLRLPCRFRRQARAVCQQGCDLSNGNTFLGDNALVSISPVRATAATRPLVPERSTTALSATIIQPSALTHSFNLWSMEHGQWCLCAPKQRRRLPQHCRRGLCALQQRRRSPGPAATRPLVRMRSTAIQAHLAIMAARTRPPVRSALFSNTVPASNNTANRFSWCAR